MSISQKNSSTTRYPSTSENTFAGFGALYPQESSDERQNGRFRAILFGREAAEDLLANLKKHLPQSRPVALTTELPLSPALERMFDSAKAVQARFQHSQIEPLHLLAAILTEEPSQGAKMLQGSGITLENVLLTLRGGH